MRHIKQLFLAITAEKVPRSGYNLFKNDFKFTIMDEETSALYDGHKADYQRKFEDYKQSEKALTTKTKNEYINQQNQMFYDAKKDYEEKLKKRSEMGITWGFYERYVTKFCEA